MYFEEVIASHFGEMTVNGTGLSDISKVTGKSKSLFLNLFTQWRAGPETENSFMIPNW